MMIGIDGDRAARFIEAVPTVKTVTVWRKLDPEEAFL